MIHIPSQQWLRQTGTCALIGLLSIQGAACSGPTACDDDINAADCPPLQARPAAGGNILLYTYSENKTNLQIDNRRDDFNINISLEIGANNLISLATLGSGLNADHVYPVSLKFPSPVAKGQYSLLLKEGTDNRNPATISNVFVQDNQGTSFASLPPFVQGGIASTQWPMVEAMGFVGSSVVTLSSGTNSMAYPAKNIKRYNVINGQLVQDTSTDYFYLNPLGAETLAAFANVNVFLLSQLTTSLLLQKCSPSPVNMSGCPQVDPNNKLAVELNKALGVSGDGSVVVMADKNGVLRGAPAKAPLSWTAVSTTAVPTAGSTVRVGLGRVDGDDQEDLVAVWQESGKSQQVRVFLRQSGGGFVENMSLSGALSQVVGEVTALAVGDVDTDGYADVVVGRGLELAVLQNQQDKFKQVWSTLLDSKQAGAAIAAVAVGRLDGTDPNKNLDIVAASNTPYDNSSSPAKSTLYLHAFRPQ